MASATIVKLEDLEPSIRNEVEQAAKARGRSQWAVVEGDGLKLDETLQTQLNGHYSPLYGLETLTAGVTVVNIALALVVVRPVEDVDEPIAVTVRLVGVRDTVAVSVGVELVRDPVAVGVRVLGVGDAVAVDVTRQAHGRRVLRQCRECHGQDEGRGDECEDDFLHV